MDKTAVRSIEEACPTLDKHLIDAPHFALQTAPEKVVAILQQAGIFSAEGCA
jgi:hypothetical protein